jgi:hypothetical protein
MGVMKNYLNNVICACSDEHFGQDAVEYAVQMGLVKLSGDLEADVKTIVSQYDDICAAYQAQLNRNQAELMTSYEPLLAEIRRVA